MHTIVLTAGSALAPCDAPTVAPAAVSDSPRPTPGISTGPLVAAAAVRVTARPHRKGKGR